MEVRKMTENREKVVVFSVVILFVVLFCIGLIYGLVKYYTKEPVQEKVVHLSEIERISGLMAEYNSVYAAEERLQFGSDAPSLQHLKSWTIMNEIIGASAELDSIQRDELFAKINQGVIPYPSRPGLAPQENLYEQFHAFFDSAPVPFIPKKGKERDRILQRAGILEDQTWQDLARKGLLVDAKSLDKSEVVQKLILEHNDSFAAEQSLEFGSAERQTQHIKSFAIFNVLAEAYRNLNAPEWDQVVAMTTDPKVIPRSKHIEGVAQGFSERDVSTLTADELREEFEVFLTSFADIDYMGAYKVIGDLPQIQKEVQKGLKKKGLLVESKK